MTLDEIIAELRERADRKVVAGMYRVGINPRGTLGVQMPELQKVARRVGKDTPRICGQPDCTRPASCRHVDDRRNSTEEQMDAGRRR